MRMRMFSLSLVVRTFNGGEELRKEEMREVAPK